MTQNHRIVILNLLTKKTITGEEFGKAFIITRLQQHHTESTNKETIFTEATLKTLYSKLANDLEINIAQLYINLYIWISRCHALAQGYYQQFYVGYSRLFFRIVLTINTENNLNMFDSLTANTQTKDLNYLKLKSFTKKVLLSSSLFSQQHNSNDIEFISAGKDLIQTSLIELFSYNKAVDLISIFLELPDFSNFFQINLEDPYAAIELLNNKQKQLKTTLLNSTTSSQLNIARKIHFLAILYPQFNVQDYEPTITAIKKAVSSFKEYIFHSNPPQLIEILKRQV
jgi:hypothetical protein